jgi:hypothetical protein
MKVIIAGSRDLEITIEELENIINNTGIDISVLLNGKCPTGIDKIAYGWAEKKYYTNRRISSAMGHVRKIGGS